MSSREPEPPTSPSGPPAPQSLADALRGWPDERLRDLLVARPDLALPAPRDSAQVAARAVTRSSMSSALDGLERLDLLVLRALVRGDAVAPDGLADLLGADLPSVRSSLARLEELALVWTGPRGLRAVGGLAGLVLAPAGLGPPTIQHDLPVMGPPGLLTTARDPVQVDRLAAGAAFDVVRRIGLLLDHWEAAPPAMLRQGGLGLRALRATAGALDADEATAALLVDVAVEARLVALGTGSGGDPVWLPTDRADSWAESPAEERWRVLTQAWLGSDRAPALVGSTPPGKGRGKPASALDPGLTQPFLSETRRMTLEALAGLAPGSALEPESGPASLVAALSWRRPRRPAYRAQQVAWTLHEAAVLGVTGSSALGTPGRSLLAGDHAAAMKLLAALLPAPVGHVLIQADLTAVAPGPLTTEVDRRLQAVADVESRGGATVYRFSGDSLRRGMDEGWSAAELHAFLADVSRTPVPQPLSYLVDDTARRFGVLRAGHAESFLRADDEAALTELLAHPDAAALQLRRLAPTVAVSVIPLDELLVGLRGLGTAPAVEDHEGMLHVRRPVRPRARAPREPSPRMPGLDLTPDQVARAVAATRAGDRAAALRPALTPVATGPGGALTALRAAVASATTVMIGYVDQHGRLRDRLVVPEEIHGGRLTAYDVQAEEAREFAIHRIAEVRQAVLPGGTTDR